MDNTTSTTSHPGHSGTTSIATTSAFADLERLDDARAETLLPVILLVGLYMLVGVVGNGLVFYIMGFKLKKNNHNRLVFYLAIFDLVNCLICMPADIYLMQRFHSSSSVSCRLVWTVTTLTNGASVLLLLIIAVDRYRQICQPFKRQMGFVFTKWCILGVTVGAVSLSWPTLFIGHGCSISSSSNDSIYPMVYAGVLFLLFIISTVTMIVLYILVIMAVRKLERNRRYMYSSIGVRHGDTSHFSTSVLTMTENKSSLKERFDSEAHQDTSTDINRQPLDTKSVDCIDNEQNHNQNVSYLDHCQTGSAGKKREEFAEELSGDDTATASSENDLSGEETSCRKQDDTNETIFMETSVCCHALRETRNQQLPANDLGSDTTKQITNGHDGLNDSLESFPQKGNSSNVDISGPNPTVHNGKRVKIVETTKQKRSEHLVTKTVLAVTVVFILSYLPFLGIRISEQIKNFNLQGAASVFYHIFFRSYYINSIANPFIYGILNTQFRHHLCVLLSNICTRRGRLFHG